MMSNSDIGELLDTFRRAVLRHYEASQNGDSDLINVQVEVIQGAFEKLSALGPDGRDALFELTGSKQLPIACMAAAYSLKYKPLECEQVLGVIAKSKDLLGFKAKYALKNWKNGEWTLG